MTYRVEQFVRKITAPVIVKINDKTLHFKSGKELARFEFDRKYEVMYLKAVDFAIEIALIEKDTNEPFNYVGETALR